MPLDKHELEAMDSELLEKGKAWLQHRSWEGEEYFKSLDNFAECIAKHIYRNSSDDMSWGDALSQALGTIDYLTKNIDDRNFLKSDLLYPLVNKLVTKLGRGSKAGTAHGIQDTRNRINKLSNTEF